MNDTIVGRRSICPQIDEGDKANRSSSLIERTTTSQQCKRSVRFWRLNFMSVDQRRWAVSFLRLLGNREVPIPAEPRQEFYPRPPWEASSLLKNNHTNRHQWRTGFIRADSCYSWPKPKASKNEKTKKGRPETMDRRIDGPIVWFHSFYLWFCGGAKTNVAQRREDAKQEPMILCDLASWRAITSCAGGSPVTDSRFVKVADCDFAINRFAKPPVCGRPRHHPTRKIPLRGRFLNSRNHVHGCRTFCANSQCHWSQDIQQQTKHLLRER